MNFTALTRRMGSEESFWVRTLKTGHVTDNFLGVKFRLLFEWIGRLGRATPCIGLEAVIFE